MVCFAVKKIVSDNLRCLNQPHPDTKAWSCPLLSSWSTMKTMAMNKATSPRFPCLAGQRGVSAYSLAFEFPRFTSRNKPGLQPGKTASKVMQKTLPTAHPAPNILLSWAVMSSIQMDWLPKGTRQGGGRCRAFH